MPHPYENAPAYRRWRAAVARPAIRAVDPLIGRPFAIAPQDRVVTAGSCFAQHIARHLRQRGYNFLQTESAHPLLSAATASAYNYGVYSARYGNIYSARQLLQLLRRAYARLQPREDCWEADGYFLDPFRPAIQPGGFKTLEEYRADRRQHFAAVRQAFESLDFFVFTLGLTESWLSRADGSVFPVCPGTVGGEFDQDRHCFHNFSVDEVSDDLCAFIDELRAVNPNAKLILSVSPVPLAATAEDRHVLVATTYSKAVLRVAAEMVSQRREHVAYFPAFEIITGAFSRGGYFAEDLRSIREEGVDHVMDTFFRHFGGLIEEVPAQGESAIEDGFLPAMRQVMDTLCEESALDKNPGQRTGDIDTAGVASPGHHRTGEDA